MTMFTEEQTRGLDLLGQCVAANVNAAAATTDRLLELKDAEIRRLASVIVALDDVLDAATVIDRATERRLRRLYPSIDSARETLERMGSAE